MKIACNKIGIIILIILFSIQPIYAIEVTVNGDTLITEDQPYISDTNRTMVPVRAISEALGLTVKWNAETREVTLSDSHTNIVYTLDNNSVLVNGVDKLLDSSPTIKNDRTYLPLSDLASHLDIGVKWDSSTETAKLTNTELGLNLSHIHYWSSQWMFKDVMKQSATWWVQPKDLSEWSVDVAVPLRDDGYPIEIPYKNHVVHTVMLMHMNKDGPMYPDGEYTLRFKGKGRILISIDDSDYSFTESETDHPIMISPSYNGIHLTILESDKDDPIHDIQMMMPGFQTDTKKPFHPEFLELISSFKTLRYMKSSYVEEQPSFLWEDRTTMNHQTQSDMSIGGLSFEYIAMLSNLNQSDPWVNVPHDSSDDYVRSLAEFYKDNLNSNLRLYIEYSNEPWNPMFSVYNDSIKKGEAMNLGQGEEAGARYNVIRSIEMMNIFKKVYGEEYKDRVTWCISTWSARQEISEYILSEMDKHEYLDAFIIAPYFGGELANDVGDGIRYTDDEVFEKIELELNTLIKDQIIWHKNEADKRNMRLMTYEAGSHFVSLFYPEDEHLIAQMKRINSDPRMTSMYQLYYDIWNTYAKDVTTLFVFCEEPNKYGDFGMIHHYDSINHPKWQFIQMIQQ